MKFYDTHYEEYLESAKKNNYHPKFASVISNLPKDCKNLRNIILYGPTGIGKYTQSLIISREGEILGSDFRGITDNEIANLPSNVRTLGTLFVIRGQDDFVTSQSVGKSVTSLLIGIAVEEGLINNIDQSASDFITEWQNDDRSNITIRSLLNMRSGLESFGGSSILDLISLEDSTTTCINRQLRGDNSFAYLNCDTQVLGEIIERASGTDLKTFADDKLFLSLGVQAYWWQDPTGNYISYAGVDLKPDEYLRLGQLFLDPNQNIVPSDYFRSIIESTLSNFNFEVIIMTYISSISKVKLSTKVIANF